MVKIFIDFFVHTNEKKSPLVFFVLFQSEILHEAEVMMKLDHPNIVRIIGTVLLLLPG